MKYITKVLHELKHKHDERIAIYFSPTQVDRQNYVYPLRLSFYLDNKFPNNFIEFENYNNHFIVSLYRWDDYGNDNKLPTIENVQDVINNYLVKLNKAKGEQSESKL